MMKKLPWLPEYAKAEDASAFLEMATGEAWPLVRILDAGAGAFVLIAPPEGTPQAVIDAVLGGRSGCFYGQVLRQDDLRRLAHSPGDATMHMTQTPEGRVINFNPPARFTSAEVRLHAADVRRIAEMFLDHEASPSRHSETLRLDGFDVTFAEGHSLRQLMRLHGDIARIELVESPPVAQSPEPAQATEAPAHAPSASASPAARPEAVAVPEPLQRQRHQEREILRVLRGLGHDPAALPARQHGRPGAKAAVWGLLAQKKWSRGVFDKAWGRLRGGGEIVGG